MTTIPKTPKTPKTPRTPKSPTPSDTPALFFEDVEVGIVQTSPWYSVERDEVIEMASRWDPYPFHLDDEAARHSVFGALAACAPHIFAISSRLSHELPGTLALIAGLGGDGLQLLAPVFSGSRVRLSRRFTGARPSESRPDAGVVSFEDSLESPDGVVVFRTSGSVLLSRRTRGTHRDPA